MKNIYKPEHKGWDRYNAFHTNFNHFASFETGETLITAHYTRPEDRKIYSEVGIELLFTSDSTKHVFIDPKTGKPIPRAQLCHRGGQHLAIDLESKRVVSIQKHENKLSKTLGNLPKHIALGSAYALSDSAPLTGIGRITINAPSVIDDEALAWRDVIHTILKLDGIDHSRQWCRPYDAVVSLDNVAISGYEFLKKAGSRTAAAIAQYGITFDRASVPVDHILIN